MVEEFQTAVDFLADLLVGAEDVSVVLLEPAHPGETSQGPGQLVPVEHAKIGEAEGELTPRSNAVVKDQTEK